MKKEVRGSFVEICRDLLEAGMVDMVGEIIEMIEVVKWCDIQNPNLIDDSTVYNPPSATREDIVHTHIHKHRSQ